MATYKVIQDIEAEDHILGPLSLKQFIFGLVAGLCFYLTYVVISKGGAFLSVIFVVPGLVAAFFAFPFGRDQPTEVWALAKLRFLFKPRRRVWDQDGVKQLVTITAPKRVEANLTNGLSQTEVRSRLSALANTIDSRGWAIKNINVNLYTHPYQPLAPTASDRLVDASSLPQEVPAVDVQAADDIMDEQSNPIARQFQQLITNSEQQHRQQIQTMLQNPAPEPVAAAAAPVQSAPQQNSTTPNYWFLSQPLTPPQLDDGQAVFAAPSVIAPELPARSIPPTNRPTASIPLDNTAAVEAALAKKLKRHAGRPDMAFSHMKTILPIEQQQALEKAAAEAKAKSPAAIPKPAEPSPATLQLANDNDKNIDVIAREAERINHPKLNSDGEVVINLH